MTTSQRSPQPSAADTFDLVVLGVGSAGKAIAPPVARAGRRVAVVEHRKLGGECPYYACMPSKFMLHDAARGRTWAEAVLRRDDHTRHADDSGVEQDFVAEGITVLRGHGVLTGPGRLAAGDRQIGWQQLVVNTGSTVVDPPVDGLRAVPTWTSEDALTATERPASLVVLGGGPVGIELAQMFARFGSTVTLVEAADRLVAREASLVGELLGQVLAADGVDVRTGTSVQRAEPAGAGARLHLDDGSTVEAERVLVAVGRAPNVQQIGLDALGIDVDAAAAGLPVDGSCRVLGVDGTALPGVWAVGDVTGIAPYTHVADYQGRVVVESMLGHCRTADYSAVPRGVYTTPAAFAIGLTPEQAREQGVDLLVARGDMVDVSRALVEGDSPLGPDGVAGGAVELYADRARGVLVGAAAVATAADAWLAEVGLAIRAQVPISTYADVVHAFPTWGEVLDKPLRALAEQLAGPSGNQLPL